jgi:hypothetical protein
MKNPIFIEYYSHESCPCYKMCLPYTSYREEKLVLCRMDEGIEKAKEIAKRELLKRIEEAFREPVEEITETLSR